MERERGGRGVFAEITVALLFALAAGWVIWNGPAYIMAFGWGPNFDALAARYTPADILDWIAIVAAPILFVVGVFVVHRAPMEYDDMGPFDRISVFVGRVTMLLVIVLVAVMSYEVLMRYVIERPTLWANELSLWMAGFIFLFSGLYAMQQRSHIRIFLLYDILPRGVQKACDAFSTLLIVIFVLALIYGAWGEASQKFLRWETFGTAFDPPIPATLKPFTILFMILVAIQAVSNLVRDWNRPPEVHTAADDIDEEEIERLRQTVGTEGVGELDVTRTAYQRDREH